MEFHKYHALGNDYLVMNPAEVGRELTDAEVVRICHRHFGIGSDGILWGPMEPAGGEKPFALRIYNPDGSIAEKSGNGLRIYSRYLWDHGFVGGGAVPDFYGWWGSDESRARRWTDGDGGYGSGDFR